MMKRRLFLGWGLIGTLGVILPSLMDVRGDGPAGSQVERGEYLVHSVARCIECHSPRDERGRIDRLRLLKGAPIPFESPFRSQQWAFQAPSIAGLPGWKGEEVVHLLMSGKRFSGHVPRSPMPQYRLNQEDAEAIVAYLKSLR